MELIRQLQHTIMEQEILNKKMDEERKQYRLELVNREANFNRMFNASPNVGVLNPIEINKVCWKLFLVETILFIMKLPFLMFLHVVKYKVE